MTNTTDKISKEATSMAPLEILVVDDRKDNGQDITLLDNMAMGYRQI